MRLKHTQNNLLNNKGQVAVEFVITFLFSTALIFLFIRLAINMTTGYLVHYATFMASRTYLSDDNASENFQSVVSRSEKKAATTFNRFEMNKFGVNPAKLKFNSPFRVNIFEYVGAYISFEKPLSDYPFIGRGEKLTFYAESFIGKEPSRGVCKARTCAAITDMGMEACEMAEDELMYTVYDNGC